MVNVLDTFRAGTQYFVESFLTEVLHATGSAHLGAGTATMIRVWGKAVDTYLTAMTSALEPGLQAEET